LFSRLGIPVGSAPDILDKDFNFKYDGPGPGKGGTDVFTVDGKEMARMSIERTIPLLLTIDETFDVGVDTRSRSYRQRMKGPVRG
jgi:hypothetical protein